MSATKYNIILEQGASFSQTLNLTDDVAAPIDLTGATVISKFREASQKDVSYSFTCIVQAPETDGQIDWSMDSATTATIPTGRGVYDLTVTYSNGTSQRIIEGEVEVKPWVGRPDI